MKLSYDVFISYSRRNRKFVSRLAKDLQSHHIKVWLDTVELLVGDQWRQKIEEGIQTSRYFCLVVSDASMKSFTVRRFELETAFAVMKSFGRQTFILPVLWKYPPDRLPPMLATLTWLDFSNPRQYMNNLKRLIQKIKLDDEHFTGERWYKNVDVSSVGQMVGIGPLPEMARSGFCVKLFYEDGRVRFMETYQNGRLESSKSVEYDALGRVVRINLFRDNRPVDSWNYVYHPKEGYRTAKLINEAGKKPYLEILYDPEGRKLMERYLNQDGTLDDSRGFAIREFVRSENGEEKGEILRDATKRIIEQR